VINRRAFISGITLGLLAAPLAAKAQQAGKVARVGVLAATDAASFAGFRQGLREFGWDEGRNVVLEVRFAGAQDERYRDLARELVRLNVDVLGSRELPVCSGSKRRDWQDPHRDVYGQSSRRGGLRRELGPSRR